MKNRNAMEGLLLFVFSSFFIRESLKLHKTGDWALSPALFPLIITIGLLLLSLSLIYKGIKEGANYSDEKGVYKRVLLIIISSFIYIYLLAKLGFTLTSIAYIFFFMWVLGERRWWVLGAISTITPLAIYYVFVNLLDVYLP